ncbi:MAG TPA: XkdF-like putative serine protease domain-containing protein [Chitinophagaceae bacterium]|nr:XkdF-like putative serine protease domain-containing protein [Chitinophagaceae bacterium]
MLPVYKCTISNSNDSPLQVQAIALVDEPAIEKNFLAFKAQQPLHFAVNTARQIISGPAMLANTPIYRKDADYGEYLVVFDKQTIETIVEKFFSKGLMASLNIMHNSSSPLQGACIFESFITDAQRGIQPMKGFEDVPEGSWFISVKINSADVWAKIKAGQVKGFSVEGLFKLMPLKLQTQALTPEKTMQQIIAVLMEGEEE